MTATALSRQQQIVNRVLNKREHFATAERYYAGTQGEVFYSDFLERDLYSDRTNGTCLNFMRPIVDNVADRLEIEKIVGTKDVTKAVEKIRLKNAMQLKEKEVHRNTSYLGEYYVMVWANDGEVKISIHDPRDTVVIYDPETNDKLVGARIWYDELNNCNKMNVFYPDRVEKYSTKEQDTNYDNTFRVEELSAGAKWFKYEEMENPFGEVPLFHFRTHGLSGRPEHLDGYGIQDSINKLSVTHMMTVDFQGAPQRYALKDPSIMGGENEDFEEGETDREETGLRNTPGGLWDLHGYKQVGQFQPAAPEIFTHPIDHLVKVLAAVTNTPLHYFQSTGNIPSGNALRAAEGPLLKKVADRQIAYGQTWDEVYTFAAKIDLNKAEVDLVLHWKSVETLDLLEVLDIYAKKRNIGLPLKQVLIEAGYDEKTIDEIFKMKAEESQMQSNGQQPQDYLRGDQTGKATNTNPAVRANVNKNETAIPTGNAQGN